MSFGVRVWMLNTVLINLGVVLIQLTLGALLLVGRERRWGRAVLVLAVALALAVRR